MVWVRADPDNSAHKVNPRLAVSGRIHLPEAACCLLLCSWATGALPAAVLLCCSVLMCCNMLVCVRACTYGCAQEERQQIKAYCDEMLERVEESLENRSPSKPNHKLPSHLYRIHTSVC